MSRERADLKGRFLYKEILRQYLGGDEGHAITVLRRSEESFAMSPVARELRYRDVVSYMVIANRLMDDRRFNSMDGIRAVISHTIPTSL